ncbi:hypothetical protein PLESTM_001074400, partial [Pleodorina starrii]
MAALSSRVNAVARHPLDQLSPDEVRRAVDACKCYASTHGVGALRFNTVMLREPAKKALLAFERGCGPRPERIAEVVAIVPSASTAVEALVRLQEDTPPTAAAAAPPSSPEGLAAQIESWKILDGVQPLTSPDDNTLAEVVVKSDLRVAQLLAERYGITDVANQLICDTWACHNAPEHLNHRRL